MNEPQHIRPAWIKYWQRVILRLQQASRTDGYAIVNIKVLVNMSGDPVPGFYTSPEIIKLEPRPKGCTDDVNDWLKALFNVLT